MPIINFFFTVMSEITTTTGVLPIEANFLTRTDVRANARLNEIYECSEDLRTSEGVKYSISLRMGAHLTKSNEWFKSNEAKELMAEEGIEWSKKEFVEKSTGISYTWFCKLVKAAKWDEVIRDAYRSYNEEHNGTLSIEGLNKFASSVNLDELLEANGEDELEDAIINAVLLEQETEAAEVNAAPETIFTISFKCESGNVAARIDELGNLITTNSDAQIIDAIAFLRSKLS